MKYLYYFGFTYFILFNILMIISDLIYVFVINLLYNHCNWSYFMIKLKAFLYVLPNKVIYLANLHIFFDLFPFVSWKYILPTGLFWILNKVQKCTPIANMFHRRIAQRFRYCFPSLLLFRFCSGALLCFSDLCTWGSWFWPLWQFTFKFQRYHHPPYCYTAYSD